MGVLFMYVVSTDRAVSPQEIFAFLHVTAGGVRARRALRHAQAPTSGTIEKIPPFGVSQKSGSRIDIRLPLFLRCILHNTAAVSPRSEKIFKPFYTFAFNLSAKRKLADKKQEKTYNFSHVFSHRLPRYILRVHSLCLQNTFVADCICSISFNIIIFAAFKA